jgi:hypothetical protein
MSRAHPGRLRAAAVLAAALAACRSDRLAGPAELRLDPTAVLNSMAYTARLTSAAVAPGGLSAAAFGVTTTPGASVLAGFRGCAYDPAAREFRCLPETRQGITLTLVYAALDAAGAPLAGPTPETTAAIRTQLTAAGTSTSTLPDGRQAAVTLDQRHDATLRGFLGGPRVLDGDLVTRTQVATSGAPTMVLRSAQATRGLTFPQRRVVPVGGHGHHHAHRRRGRRAADAGAHLRRDGDRDAGPHARRRRRAALHARPRGLGARAAVRGGRRRRVGGGPRRGHAPAGYGGSGRRRVDPGFRPGQRSPMPPPPRPRTPRGTARGTAPVRDRDAPAGAARAGAPPSCGGAGR